MHTVQCLMQETTTSPNTLALHIISISEPDRTSGTMISAHASKMLLVLPLCALFTSSGLEAGKAASSHA